MRETHRRELVQHELAQLSPLLPRFKAHACLENRYFFFSLTTPRGRDYLFRLDLADYDVEAPSLEVVDAALRERTTREAWPPGGFAERFDHPDTGRPWLCMRGLRDFYTHPLHMHQRWDHDRIRIRLPVLLKQIIDHFDANTRGT